jgi:hypothetical protein
MLYSKEQQAGRMRVHVKQLRGPVFADYELLPDVPNGAILVAWDEADAARLRLSVKSGVMVVTREQEQGGIAYVDPRPTESNSSQEDVYEVEAVVKARKKRKGMQYLIKWKGYDEADNSWEPAENVSEELIAQYHGERAVAGAGATTATESQAGESMDAAESGTAATSERMVSC